MAQKGAIFVFCSSCKILNFANYISPRIIAEVHSHIKDIQIDLQYKNQNVRERKALNKG